jgi:hypothetical protein
MFVLSSACNDEAVAHQAKMYTVNNQLSHKSGMCSVCAVWLEMDNFP